MRLLMVGLCLVCGIAGAVNDDDGCYIGAVVFGLLALVFG